MNNKTRTVKDLSDRIKLLERTIMDIYDICLCERFKTKGFDYHEKHPRRKEKNGGSRPHTPRALIENYLGFDWSEGGKHPKIIRTWNK